MAVDPSGTPVPTPVEPGYTTTEFWVTFAGLISAGFTLLFHKTLNIDPSVPVGAASIMSGGYSIARGIAKRG